MLRVAHFLGTMKPGHDGVTRVMYRLREEFEKTDTQNCYISPLVGSASEPDIYKVSSVPFPVYPEYRLATCSVDTVAKILGNKPDIIHTHSPCPLGNIANKYGSENQIPVVATYHTHFPTYLRYYRCQFLAPWVWKYFRYYYGHCKAIIVPSKTTLFDLDKQGLKNLIHIPHGVDTNRFSPKHRSDAWRRAIGAEGKVVLSFVGRLVWEKNLMTLVHAWQYLSRRKVQMVFIGDGPAKEKLRSLLPEAHFTGHLGETDLPVAYASSDVLMFPSVTETFGNVSIEAMASGLPVVGAAAGGSCDIIIHGETGFLVSVTDPKEYSQALETLVNNPDLRKKLGEGALLASRKFHWSITASRYINLYQRILNSPEAVVAPEKRA